MLEHLITSKAKRKLLVLFCLNPERRFYARELERLTGEPINAIRRGLAALEKAGLLKSTREGNIKYYMVDRASPIFPELKRIVLMTAGIGERLRAEFADRDSIKLAFIYGSVARDEENSESDIDLMIVGDADELELHRAISDIEKEIRREINYTLMTPEEFRERLRRNDPFVNRIMDEEKVVLKGNPDEFR